MAGLLGRIGCVVALLTSLAPAAVPANSTELARSTASFDKGWLLNKREAEEAQAIGFNDSAWDKFDAPYDWSIAGPYDEKAPSFRGGGYLPSGIG